MNNNEQNSSLSLGCSIAGLVFFGLVLLIEKNQKFSILRYNRHTEIADYRVYHFKELASWYLHIEETEDSALFFTIRQVTEIAVVFEISYNNQNIRHYIQLYKGKPLSQPVFAEYREKLKHIQRFLSCIKPESPNPNIPI